MSTRRNPRKYKEPNTNVSPIFFFYLFTFGSIGLLALTLWMFGIDFGFIRFGGTVTMGSALWIFLGSLVIEYFVDARYAMNLYKKFKIPTGYAFIPIINSVMLWGKLPKIVAFSCIAFIGGAVILIVSPVVTYIDPSLVGSVSIGSAIFIICAGLVICIIRGIQMARLKINLINRYTKLVGIGASPVMGFMKSILYFVPVIRIVLLIEDMTFIDNVFATIAKNKRIERGTL